MRRWMAIVGACLLAGSVAGCPPDRNAQNQPRTGQSGGSGAAGAGAGTQSSGAGNQTGTSR